MSTHRLVMDDREEILQIQRYAHDGLDTDRSITTLPTEAEIIADGTMTNNSSPIYCRRAYATINTTLCRSNHPQRVTSQESTYAYLPDSLSNTPRSQGVEGASSVPITPDSSARNNHALCPFDDYTRVMATPVEGAFFKDVACSPLGIQLPSQNSHTQDERNPDPRRQRTMEALSENNSLQDERNALNETNAEHTRDVKNMMTHYTSTVVQRTHTQCQHAGEVVDAGGSLDTGVVDQFYIAQSKLLKHVTLNNGRLRQRAEIEGNVNTEERYRQRADIQPLYSPLSTDRNVNTEERHRQKADIQPLYSPLSTDRNVNTDERHRQGADIQPIYSPLSTDRNVNTDETHRQRADIQPLYSPLSTDRNVNTDETHRQRADIQPLYSPLSTDRNVLTDERHRQREDIQPLCSPLSTDRNVNTDERQRFDNYVHGYDDVLDSISAVSSCNELHYVYSPCGEPVTIGLGSSSNQTGSDDESTTDDSSAKFTIDNSCEKSWTDNSYEKSRTNNSCEKSTTDNSCENASVKPTPTKQPTEAASYARQSESAYMWRDNAVRGEETMTTPSNIVNKQTMPRISDNENVDVFTPVVAAKKYGSLDHMRIIKQENAARKARLKRIATKVECSPEAPAERISHKGGGKRSTPIKHPRRNVNSNYSVKVKPREMAPGMNSDSDSADTSEPKQNSTTEKILLYDTNGEYQMLDSHTATAATGDHGGYRDNATNYKAHHEFKRSDKTTNLRAIREERCPDQRKNRTTRHSRPCTGQVTYRSANQEGPYPDQARNHRANHEGNSPDKTTHRMTSHGRPGTDQANYRSANQEGSSTDTMSYPAANHERPCRDKVTNLRESYEGKRPDKTMCRTANQEGQSHSIPETCQVTYRSANQERSLPEQMRYRTTSQERPCTGQVTNHRESYEGRSPDQTTYLTASQEILHTDKATYHRANHEGRRKRKTTHRMPNHEGSFPNQATNHEGSFPNQATNQEEKTTYQTTNHEGSYPDQEKNHTANHHMEINKHQHTRKDKHNTPQSRTDSANLSPFQYSSPSELVYRASEQQKQTSRPKQHNDLHVQRQPINNRIVEKKYEEDKICKMPRIENAYDKQRQKELHRKNQMAAQQTNKIKKCNAEYHKKIHDAKPKIKTWRCSNRLPDRLDHSQPRKTSQTRLPCIPQGPFKPTKPKSVDCPWTIQLNQQKRRSETLKEGKGKKPIMAMTSGGLMYATYNYV